jgi:hypothetical protein
MVRDYRAEQEAKKKSAKEERRRWCAKCGVRRASSSWANYCQLCASKEPEPKPEVPKPKPKPVEYLKPTPKRKFI